MKGSRYLLSQYLPIFLGGVLFFALIVELVDMFANLFLYIQNNLSVSQIAYLQLLFLPRAIVYGLPIASVFAVSYALGTMQVRFELLAFSAIGISLLSLLRGILLAALLAGIAAVGLQEFIAIPSLQTRESFLDAALSRSHPLSRSRIDLYDKKSGLVYKARFYNHENQTLSDLYILERDEEGNIKTILDAKRAVWKENVWLLFDVTEIILPQDKEAEFSFYSELSRQEINIEPTLFQNLSISFDSMNWSEASLAVAQKKRTGIPYKAELTRLYERLSFGLTPLVVTLLAVGAGRKIKKHVVLMGLLLSLFLAVLYYVFQLSASLLAGMGILDPILGAFTSIFLFLFAGLTLLGISQRA